MPTALLNANLVLAHPFVIGEHLLATARLTAGAKLWTHDKRLRHVAVALGLAAAPK